MDADKFQQAWKADSARMHVTIDADLLSNEVQRFHRDFQSTIFWRDIREAGTSLLLIPIWFAMGIPLSLPWTWYLTVPALIWVAGFLLMDRRRHPQRSSEPGEPLRFYVKESLTQVEHQIWLLRNVFWWYLLPFSLSIMAFFLQVAWNTSGGGWGFVVVAAFLGLFLFVIYGGTYRLNQRAVRNQLEPRRQDLLKLVASLEGEANSEDSGGDIMELVSALADPFQNSGLNSSWAENWNRIVPSWRAAAVIILPTLGGALCGLLSGLHFQIRDMGPTLFQTVVGAVIPFEIALGLVWWRFRKKQKQSALTDHEFNAPDSEVVWDDSATKKRKLLPRAPAMVILLLILFLSVMAVLAILSCIAQLRGDGASGDANRLTEPDFADVSAFDDRDIAHIATWLQKQVELAKYPSLTVAIVRDGQNVYEGAFGIENIKTGKQATLQTPYHVASVTKAFTASLAAMLHEQGVVNLDQRVVTYLPKGISISTKPDVGATITLRQLASHTAGLPREVPGRVQSVEGWYDLEPQRLYDLLANVKLNSEPGTAEEYSNLGFGLLGHVLERAADKPLDRLLQELICDPLKLERTAFQVDNKIRPATGYDDSDWRFEKTHSFRERLAGSGGLVASVEDLSKFLAAQMEPGVFSREMLEQLQTRTSLSNEIEIGTTLGWSSRFNPFIGRFLTKNGGRSNCSAWIGFSSEHNVGVAVVTNCGGPDVDSIGEWLLERSIPGAYQPVARYGYARVAPYTGVRWENDRPIVRVRDEWRPLVSIDGIPIDRIMEFATKEFSDKARKRLAEDLVEVLSKMGHEPDWEVTLGLETQGQVEQLQILMTEHNRALVRD
jgi:CubicO group peptidase (beta-lactamase class C family)